MPLGIAAGSFKPAVAAARRVLHRGAARIGLRPVQLVVVVLLLAAGFAGAAFAVSAERADQRQARHAWAQRSATALDDDVTAAGAALTGARALFSAKGTTVSPDAFDLFGVVGLEDSKMLSLNWAPRVSAAARARYERDAGRPIVEATPTGEIRVAGARREYFPLALEAPRTFTSALAAGFDVSTDPTLRPSLARARDSGRPVLTDTLTLSASGVPTKVAFLAAVYGPDPRPASLAARRAGLRGYTGGVFGISSLAGSALDILPAGGRLQIASVRRSIFDSGRGVMPSAVGEARVGSTGWSVRVALDQGSAVQTLPVMLLAGGSLALALLVCVLFAQANQRRREHDDSRRRLQHEADTDGLTGLANRRRLERDLETAVEAASADQPLALMFLDLNGFKGYNDRFGHPAGDELLERLSARLVAAVPLCRVYRVGGDEFCVLASLPPSELMEATALALAALTERGEGFAISAAHGLAIVPDDATTPDGAMLVADHRMYARKALGRESAGRQSADVLMRAIAERTPDLEDHTQGVADLADRVARRLGLGDTERSPVRRAALLHDVGKIAIPDSILEKAGPLDLREIAFVRRHTLVGERIVRAAPALEAVAPIVRSSHEHWDGAGYPDGLAGEAIPLGARIVFACDAFEAMTSSQRPYRGARTAEAALEELLDCAGTQFDPRVVEALVAVVRDEMRRARPADPAPVSPPGRAKALRRS